MLKLIGPHYCFDSSPLLFELKYSVELSKLETKLIHFIYSYCPEVPGGNQKDHIDIILKNPKIKRML